jgi:hypothetical protein
MIYNNILIDEDYRNLYDLINSVEFPWFYQENIAYSNNLPADKNTIESCGFTHLVWDIDQGKVSGALPFVAPIIDRFKIESGVIINNFLRIKINLQTAIPNNNKEKYNGIHVDRLEPHKTLIYYLDDSDGFTFVFNELYDYMNHKLPEQYSVCTTIKPIRNSLFYLENGLRFHSGSNPIESKKRITININFN